MPQVLKRHPPLANPDGNVGDGISLTGGKFTFTNFKENEMSLEGVMFYSTDPASGGSSLVWPLVLMAASLALVGSGAAALALFVIHRRFLDQWRCRLGKEVTR